MEIARKKAVVDKRDAGLGKLKGMVVEG